MIFPAKRHVVNVSTIFRDRYPYFKAEDDRWKNSVRHNLSMNPHFRKGNKAKHGSGHLWVLADYDAEAETQPEEPRVVSDLVPTVIDHKPLTLVPSVRVLFCLASALENNICFFSRLILQSRIPSQDDDESARAVLSILGQNEAQLLDADKENSLIKPPLKRTQQSDRRSPNAKGIKYLRDDGQKDQTKAEAPGKQRGLTRRSMPYFKQPDFKPSFFRSFCYNGR